MPLTRPIWFFPIPSLSMTRRKLLTTIPWPQPGQKMKGSASLRIYFSAVLFISRYLRDFFINCFWRRKHASNGAEALNLVTARDSLYLTQILAHVHFRHDYPFCPGTGSADLLLRHGPDGVELEHTDLHSLVPCSAHGGEGASANGSRRRSQAFQRPPGKISQRS